MKHYGNLNQMLEQNPQAASYYSKLPDYVKEAVQERESGVNSYESLRNYVDKLTRGDN